MLEYTGIFPDEVRKLVPEFGRQDGLGGMAIAQVKFFQPWGSWTWYVTEGEPVLDDDGTELDFEFFGFVVGEFPEWGSFSLNELKSIHGPVGLKIERDIFWEPTPLKKCPGYTS
jgi:hypothetical protein